MEDTHVLIYNSIYSGLSCLSQNQLQPSVFLIASPTFHCFKSGGKSHISPWLADLLDNLAKPSLAAPKNKGIHKFGLSCKIFSVNTV